jgi:non-ribosomal peptide synthetase component E (peptide arylation enzyme)
MATFNKFDSFVEALAEKKHDLGSNTLTVALCASANAPVASNTVLANLTQIAYTNLSSRVITTASSVQTSGVYKLTLTDLVLTATGTVADFRYIVIYNDTATNDELIGWFDYGTNVSMMNGDTFAIDFDGSNGALTLT